MAGAFHPSRVDDAGHTQTDAAQAAGDVIAGWLDSEGIEDGVPFLISPDGHYDIDLNAYFLLHPAPENTLAAIAYDLASFLTFLWHHRQPLGKRSWRDATPEDRAAYHRWRRIDERGPGVKGSTWGREVATVNSFYRWAIESGFVEQNPILQRPARDRRWRRRPEAATDAGRSAQGWSSGGFSVVATRVISPLA